MSCCACQSTCLISSPLTCSEAPLRPPWLDGLRDLAGRLGTALPPSGRIGQEAAGGCHCWGARGCCGTSGAAARVGVSDDGAGTSGQRRGPLGRALLRGLATAAAVCAGACCCSSCCCCCSCRCCCCSTCCPGGCSCCCSCCCCSCCCSPSTDNGGSCFADDGGCSSTDDGRGGGGGIGAIMFAGRGWVGGSGTGESSSSEGAPGPPSAPSASKAGEVGDPAHSVASSCLPSMLMAGEVGDPGRSVGSSRLRSTLVAGASRACPQRRGPGPTLPEQPV